LQAVKLVPDDNYLPITAFDMWEAQAKAFASTARPMTYPDHFGEEREGWGLGGGLRDYLAAIDPEAYPEVKALNAWSAKTAPVDEKKEAEEDAEDATPMEVAAPSKSKAAAVELSEDDADDELEVFPCGAMNLSTNLFIDLTLSS